MEGKTQKSCGLTAGVITPKYGAFVVWNLIMDNLITM